MYARLAHAATQEGNSYLCLLQRSCTPETPCALDLSSRRAPGGYGPRRPPLLTHRPLHELHQSLHLLKVSLDTRRDPCV